VAANPDIDDPDLIYTGQQLTIPALIAPEPPVAAAPPPTPSPATSVAADPAAPTPSTSAEWPVHTVVDGDNLWDILEHHYGDASADLVWSVASYNAMADPSDITSGTAITLPPIEVLNGDIELPPVIAQPTPSPASTSTTPTLEVEDPPPARDVPVVPSTVEPGRTPEPRLIPAAPPPIDRPTTPSATDRAVPTTSAGHEPAVTSIADDGVALAPWLAGLAGTTTLAAGLLAVYRRLRHRQAAAGAAAWRLAPSGPSARLHRQLVSAADLPLVRWAGQELSGVLFGRGRPEAGPVAVELSEANGLELLWDAPMSAAPDPWEATADGWAWRLLYDPRAEVPEAKLPAAVPALVTIGNRDGHQVLVDLEAYGSLAIGGDAKRAEDLLRSVVLEYGAGEELSDAWVSTVGLGVDGTEHLARVQARTESEALAHAMGFAADQREVMETAGVDGTFVLRASAPPTNREVSVIAVHADDFSRLDELLALARPRSGVVVVVLGSPKGAGAHLDVEADGTAQLTPLGLTLSAAGVSHEAAANAAVLLDGAAEHVTVEDLAEVAADEQPDGVGTHPEQATSADGATALNGSVRV
ncbi:MAG: LysM peptidoglycan-binding domain-containing protein, partial [Ilumatobacteraceae bacterium]